MYSQHVVRGYNPSGLSMELMVFVTVLMFLHPERCSPEERVDGHPGIIVSPDDLLACYILERTASTFAAHPAGRGIKTNRLHRVQNRSDLTTKC